MKKPASCGLLHLCCQVAPARGRVTAERRKPPARLPAGLEGMRMYAHPPPARCRRVPSRSAKHMKKPASCGFFRLCFRVADAHRVSTSVIAVRIAAVFIFGTPNGSARVSAMRFQPHDRLPTKAVDPKLRASTTIRVYDNRPGRRCLPGMNADRVGIGRPLRFTLTFGGSCAGEAIRPRGTSRIASSCRKAGRTTQAQTQSCGQ